MDTKTFNIPSISCSACSNKIQQEIKNLNGVSNISVDLKTQSVTVDYNAGQISAQEIGRRISSLGYEVIQ